MYRKVLLNWMAFGDVLFHCFDHEIVLEGMKEEISQQRCTIGAHGYTNNLPENRVSKANVDEITLRAEPLLSLAFIHGKIGSAQI